MHINLVNKAVRLTNKAAQYFRLLHLYLEALKLEDLACHGLFHGIDERLEALALEVIKPQIDGLQTESLPDSLGKLYHCQVTDSRLYQR